MFETRISLLPIPVLRQWSAGDEKTVGKLGILPMFSRLKKGSFGVHAVVKNEEEITSDTVYLIPPFSLLCIPIPGQRR